MILMVGFPQTIASYVVHIWCHVTRFFFFAFFPNFLPPCITCIRRGMLLDFVATVMAFHIPMHEEKLRKGLWLQEEDELLTATVSLLGERRWDALAKASGLRRSGKSCRLRWMNYLRPNLKHGQISTEEERIILQLHHQWGNKWSKIARRLPGRTDNEIKNYWRSHLSKKAQVQEQENTTDDRYTLRTSNGDCMSGKENNSGTSIDSGNTAEPSNFAVINSPYETRLSDWISCWSYEKTEIKHQGGCCSLDFLCSTYTGCISKEGDNSVWDSSGFLWGQD